MLNHSSLQFLNFTIHISVEIVGCVINPVIRNAILRIIICANTIAAITSTYLLLTRGTPLIGCTLTLSFKHTCPQDF
jgi:hypothetical protein